jgi:anti-sigma regulatory factor (Ser/Thr protein kinase)/CheY-like chemotaxis protein
MSPSPVPKLTGPVAYLFPAKAGMLREVRACVTRLAGAAGITGPELHRIVLVANEAAANAIQHSGSDVICVRWENGDQGVWITVTDDGVFDMRMDHAGERGLGMKLMLRLADEVTVQAGRRGERGTTVRLHMQVRSRAGAAPAAAPGRARLLLVERDRFAARSLSAFLDAEGYPVAVAASVPAARAALDSPPRLAIVDLMTSNGSVLELCDQIRRAGIALLTTSVLPPPTTLRSDRFMRKPVHPLEVLAVVQQLAGPVDTGTALDVGRA